MHAKANDKGSTKEAGATSVATNPPAALSFARDDIVLHKKTQHTYRVLGRCIIEATLADCYIYRGSDGRTWIRPVAEMEDGRFVLIESTAPGASEIRGSVPEGFVLVPKVPTQAMLDAASASQDRGDWIGAFYFQRAWPHMLAAAPTPPAVSNGEPQDWAIAQAFRESLPWSHEPDRMLVVLQHAKELARSAAAKGGSTPTKRNVKASVEPGPVNDASDPASSKCEPHLTSGTE